MLSNHFSIPSSGLAPRVVFIMFVVFLQLNALSQNPFREYLLNRSDQDIDAFLLSLDELYRGHSMAKPIVRQIELRTETNRFQLDRQEYTMRLGLNEFGNKHFQEQLNQKNQELLHLEVTAWEAQMLYQRYLNVSRFWELVETDSISETRVKLIDKLRNILALKITDKPAVSKELLQLDIDRAEVSAQRNALASELNALHQITGVSFDRAVTRPHLPQVEAIAQFISDSITTRVQSKTLDAKMQRSSIAHQMRMTEDRQILDFVQFKYSPRSEELFEERASLGIGLRLPAFYNKGRRTAIARADTLHIGLEGIMQQRELELELEMLRREILSTSVEYKSLDQTINQYANSSIVEKLLTANILEPASVIELAEMLERQKEKQVKRYYQLLRSYLKYLYKSGVMVSHGVLDYFTIPFSQL